jgi:eukaryotic-like serine/threonine-protein kinase
MPNSQKTSRATHSPPEKLRDSAVFIQQIGSYRLLRRISLGGMSSVYQAIDEVSHETVALKILADTLQSKPEFVRRFRREGRLIQMIRHPNIVKGLASDFDEPTQKRYLAMEFIQGPNSAAVIEKQKRLPAAIVARIGLDIASALQFLHKINFVHRDVKPENILLDPSGHAKLADFGLLKKIENGADLTASNQGVGTPHYMPYEQAQNSSFVDGRSDLFSLGASLYHMLTGELPFPGKTQEEVEKGKDSGHFKPIRLHRKDTPQQLDSILTKAIKRNVLERYQTASELILDLEPLAASHAEFSEFIRSLSGEQLGTEINLPTRPDLVIEKNGVNQTYGSRKSLAVLALAGLLASFWLIRFSFNRSTATPENPKQLQVTVIPEVKDKPGLVPTGWVRFKQ